jgi:hypothetical protein
MLMVVFWVVCHVDLQMGTGIEDGGSIFLLNIGNPAESPYNVTTQKTAVDRNYLSLYFMKCLLQ